MANAVNYNTQALKECSKLIEKEYAPIMHYQPASKNHGNAWT